MTANFRDSARFSLREPWRAWSHADWMTGVVSVLTLRDGRACTVAPLDARTRMTRSVLAELGIRGVHGHRLDLPAACPEALIYTDVLAAARTPELWHDPRQPVAAVEIDAESDMTAVTELADRLCSGDALRLNVTEGIVVADESKRAKFAARRAQLRPGLRKRLTFWAMKDVYAAYCAVRRAYLRGLVHARPRACSPTCTPTYDALRNGARAAAPRTLRLIFGHTTCPSGDVLSPEVAHGQGDR